MSQGQQANQEDFVWVITENIGGQESILGMEAGEADKFIPATASKDEILILMGRMPAGQGGERQAEAIHKDRLLKKAAEGGYLVYLVDKSGKILESLGPKGKH